MNSINIKATHSTPAIRFGADGRLFIEGRALRLDVLEFYKSLIDWASILQIENVTIDINLEYVDTGCSMLLHLLRTLDTNNNIKKLIVNWHYEEVDDDALEDGQILKEVMHKAEFRFIEHPEAIGIKADHQ
jgi:hypothetical protein